MWPGIAGLLLVTAALTGCAGSMDSPSAMPMATALAGGSWSGYAGVGAASGPASMTLTQTGNTVRGNIDIAGRPDMSGDVVGTVDGNALKLTLPSGYGTLPTMTITRQEISGIFPLGPITLRRAD